MKAQPKPTDKDFTQPVDAPKIGMVSLGCPKALVDSERIMTKLRSDGYKFTDSAEGADLVIVNTCGFLDSAKAESLNAIGDALKENGRVIVTGCMGAQSEEITDKYPKVLAVTGPHQYEQVVEQVYKHQPIEHNPFTSLLPSPRKRGPSAKTPASAGDATEVYEEAGLKLTPRHYAYLKISEGCNNRCSFCIIPSLRGDLVSRPVHRVLHEAESLAKAGVKELLVISQDTSAYGIDLKYAESPWKGRKVPAKFYNLCEELGQLGIWVRLHYVYPYPHVDSVIPLMADGKILPYLDIPFQHASPNVLKAMRRPAAQEKTLARIQKWREICPELTLRSTFIVGFPGETEEDFEFLLQWLEEAQIDRAGAFQYEPVKGAKANEIAEQVPDEIKEIRWQRFMEKQQEISRKKASAKIGQVLECLVDEVGGDGADARSKADAPDIDGTVFLRDAGHLKPGDFVKVKIEDAEDYDLYGLPVQG
ncbi:MAG: 30S ribosomal protein S12 methylthiotransferase RimO [Alphaproteobacteria bacterium]|nr:30S ribosomal protein S12 methylthiotransferase RimO [Alphaproteobacteria bacterium]